MGVGGLFFMCEWLWSSGAWSACATDVGAGSAKWEPRQPGELNKWADAAATRCLDLCPLNVGVWNQLLRDIQLSIAPQAVIRVTQYPHPRVARGPGGRSARHKVSRAQRRLARPLGIDSVLRPLKRVLAAAQAGGACPPSGSGVRPALPVGVHALRWVSIDRGWGVVLACEECGIRNRGQRDLVGFCSECVWW